MTDRPRNLPQLLGDRRTWFDEAVAAAMLEAGERPVTFAQQNVFAHLDPDGTTVAELARRMGMARQSAHQAVHALVGMGLLDLVPDPSSSRRRLARLTPEGRRVHERAQALIARLEEDLAARLGPSTLDALRAVLDRPWGEPRLRAEP
ncbi:MarR family winged helix-turn-helix transcriptional regulator [Actinomadura parmotrematis]|uniref:MarR family transcriptional regulator n=1 Tax=Actinomadura parmotrematis TaxID=2864039 RepID=A0ABS7G6E0_9ACTN|nr:MarR family transcriptional regulator [Actinomadura parmotrematis]MBW8487377.1 MarR family transcriptional regulator [Actinomadura parmotrematis]